MDFWGFDVKIGNYPDFKEEYFMTYKSRRVYLDYCNNYAYFWANKFSRNFHSFLLELIFNKLHPDCFYCPAGKHSLLPVSYLTYKDKYYILVETGLRRDFQFLIKTLTYSDFFIVVVPNIEIKNKYKRYIPDFHRLYTLKEFFNLYNHNKI